MEQLVMNKTEKGLNVINTIKKTLPSCIQQKKIFTFDGVILKVIAFEKGIKHEKLQELKDFLKKAGYVYDFLYECYMKNVCTDNCSYEYRKERDEFLNNFVSWKLIGK